jgi:hypothetical protein
MHIFLHHLLNIPLQREGGGEGYDYMDYARAETGTTTSEGSTVKTTYYGIGRLYEIRTSCARDRLVFGMGP